MTRDPDPEPARTDDDAAHTGRAEVYGAAPERTTLAWQRTGLGVVVCSFLIFHTAIQLGVLAVGALAGSLGVVVAALAIFSFPARRYRAGHPADSWRLLIYATVSVVGLGGLGAVTAAMTLFR